MIAIAVDDERLALESLRVKLSHIERIRQVHAFSEPEEALDFFERNGADIAFLDINMESMDGLTLAARMRETKPSMLIVFVTGYAEYSLDAMKLHADGYLMKPMDEEDIERELDALEQLRRSTKGTKRIQVQCFGNFDVFVDGKPVVFSRSKSKELLAYLVDRRGATCTSEEQADILWEDGAYDRSRQKQLSTIRREMVSALVKAGADKMLVGTGDVIAVRPDEFDCDYYMALAEDAGAINRFMGEYMAAYSWAEMTAGALIRKFRLV